MWFLATQQLILSPDKCNNTLIKISVLNLLHYWNLVLGGLVTKYYLLNKISSIYILTLVKPLPLTEMAELPELPDWENLDWDNYLGIGMNC